jgi:alpha-2-macroglobulin
MRLPCSLLSLTLTACLLAGCSASSDPPDASRQQAQWGQYIAGHTAGLVSRNSKIRVLFVNAMVAKDAIGTSANHLLEIFPPVPFSSTFVSEREILITPGQPLSPGASYRVRVRTNKLAALPEKLDIYEFGFNVIQPDFEVKLSGLSATSGNRAEMALHGTLTTADFEDIDQVEKMVSAKLAAKEQKITWQHASDGRRHDFDIDHIGRYSRDATLIVSWNGSPIGVDRSGEEAVQVPASSAFKVTQVAAVTEAPQHIVIPFSDVLETHQNLSGMITTDQGRGKVRVEGNLLHVYPAKRFTGEVSLTVDSRIKNARGERLGQSVQQIIRFEARRPQVRFAEKRQVLPDNAVLSIPFEAVNVNSVQVTAYRVSDDNVGRFLQASRPESEQDLGRLGRFLWRKTVPVPSLHADAWSRYELDAAQLLKDNPGGLFRITLSINRANSAYACTSADNHTSTRIANREDRNRKDQPSLDYAEELNDTEHDQSTWADRANPCKDAYYKFANGVRESGTFLVSDIGLLVQRDQRGKVHAVATSVKTAEPLSGATLKLYNSEGQAVATAVTDSDGFAELEPSSVPFYLDAEHNGQKGYLKLNTAAALSVSRFEIASEKPEGGIKAVIYSERAVWRPGEDIHLTFMLQDKDGVLPPNQPITLHFYNPQNQLIQSVTNARPIGGFYTFKLTTARDAPAGSWTARAKLGSSTFATTVKVETVVPDRLKLELDLGKDALYEERVPLGAQVNAKWLHGAMAAGLKADVAVRLQSIPTRFGSSTDFVFDDPLRQFKGERQMLFEGRLDDQGQARFERELRTRDPAPGALAAEFTTRVFEESGAFSSSHTNVPFYPYPHFVGIHMPKGGRPGAVLFTDTTHTIAIATFDAHGKLVSLPRVQVTMYKLESKWRAEKSDDMLAQLAKGEHSTPLKQEEIATTNGQGTFEFEVKYPEWGRYLLRACDSEGGHCSGAVFDMDWPGWAQQAREAGGSGVGGELSVTSEKHAYKVGETALIQLPSTARGRALITVENGNQVLTKQWVEVSNDHTRFELPVSSSMAPLVYVSVTLIHPGEGKDNERPLRLYGSIPLRVDDAVVIDG